MDLIIAIIIAVGCLIVGVALGYGIFRYAITKVYDAKIKEASLEADTLKKKKELEVKEKFLEKKAELEREANQNNQRLQQQENKLKQRELTLNQRQEELQRKQSENDRQKTALEKQQELLNQRKQEVEVMRNQEIKRLEEISGLSADAAKDSLVEALRDEAKTQAQQYINEIMDEAKMTANKEAKKIVIQSIQRIATETAIENSVTVFHIDSDEVKGRVIGREGRNIRALEAATGVES